MKINCIVLILLSAFISKAQTIEFNNNNSTLLLMNPSFAGTTGGTRVQSTAFIRNLSQNFRSANMQTSVDHYLENAHAGIGCSVAMQKISFFSQTDVSLNWAQHIELANKRVKLIPSFILGYRRLSVDPTFFSPSPLLPTQTTSNEALLGGSVLLEIYERLYIGVVLRDFNPLADPSSRVAPRSNFTRSFNASYNLQVSKNDLLQAVVRFCRMDGFGRSQLGVNYLHKHFLVGAGISANDVTYLQLGYKTSLLTASMQAEITHSRLAGNLAPALGLNLAANIRSHQPSPVWKSVETW